MIWLFKRDASAAAVTASALLELGQHVARKFAITEALRYWAMADRILMTLSSTQYRILPSKSQGFLLQHSVGNFPSKTEVDVPLIYADYYFVEALMRHRELFRF